MKMLPVLWPPRSAHAWRPASARVLSRHSTPSDQSTDSLSAIEDAQMMPPLRVRRDNKYGPRPGPRTERLAPRTFGAGKPPQVSLVVGGAAAKLVAVEGTQRYFCTDQHEVVVVKNSNLGGQSGGQIGSCWRLIPEKRRKIGCDQGFLAERVGFEPTEGFPSHDFQSCRFGRSRTPPGVSFPLE